MKTKLNFVELNYFWLITYGRKRVVLYPNLTVDEGGFKSKFTFMIVLYENKQTFI